jgi:hypothetical protein
VVGFVGLTDDKFTIVAKNFIHLFKGLFQVFLRSQFDKAKAARSTVVMANNVGVSNVKLFKDVCQVFINDVKGQVSYKERSLGKFTTGLLAFVSSTSTSSASSTTASTGLARSILITGGGPFYFEHSSLVFSIFQLNSLISSLFGGKSDETVSSGATIALNSNSINTKKLERVGCLVIKVWSEWVRVNS